MVDKTKRMFFNVESKPRENRQAGTVEEININNSDACLQDWEIQTQFLSLVGEEGMGEEVAGGGWVGGRSRSLGTGSHRLVPYPHTDEEEAEMRAGGVVINLQRDRLDSPLSVSLKDQQHAPARVSGGPIPSLSLSAWDDSSVYPSSE
jgi:hypothetical protein